jgi:uncharacterized protein
MLIEFKVTNYRSIRAEQTLSMVASNYSDELPENLISCDLPGMKGARLVKAVALYGANASGKSNVIAALRFFAEFVRDSATKIHPGAPTGAQPFKLDSACLTEPSKFEITAVINGIRTLYGLELTRERVTSEYLVAYPKGRPQVWFERDWDAAKGKYIWSRSTEYFKHDFALRKKTRENAAFLSVASQFAQPEAAPVAEWFENGLTLLNLSRDLGRTHAARVILKDNHLRRLIIAAVKNADVGVTDIKLRNAQPAEFIRTVIRSIATDRHLYAQVAAEFEKEAKRPRETLASDVLRLAEDSPEDYATPHLVHRSGGHDLGLDFYDEESVGTQRYLELVAELLVATATGRPFIIDELDTSLHPLLCIELLRSFFWWKGEIPGAQLIFTTHNPLLLDQTLLRRDQIWFTEKDQEGATTLYPLTDYQPRKDESLVKGYLAGRYGGVPFIPDGLKL